ncbi:MAG: hypothetical protein KC656_06360, partial [Myxococcales bacterium]|nr:hypothetical protein [Myxococcales bacterium]
MRFTLAMNIALIGLLACKGEDPTESTPPPPDPTGTESCGSTPPVVNDVTIVPGEITADVPEPHLVVTYDVSDADGDLIPGTYFLFYDNVPDGQMDLQAVIDANQYLAADLSLDPGEEPCSYTELVLPLRIVPADLDGIDLCTGYDWAVGLVDAQENNSEPLILLTAYTPDADGNACGPQDTGDTGGDADTDTDTDSDTDT